MDFFIRQTATEPILKLKVIDDGTNDRAFFNDLLENSTITFEMFDVKTGEPQILNSPCFLTNVTRKVNQTVDEYYINHRFSEFDTLVKGRFEGIVTIEFLNVDLVPLSKLIVPIKEKLYINIV